MELMLKAGADPWAKSEEGKTLLHFAAGSGSAAAVESLLKAGADPKAKDDSGKTPADRTYDPALKAMLA
jgi:cytohesin